MLEPKWRHAKAGRVPRPMPKQPTLGDFVSANSFAILQRPENLLANTLEVPKPGGEALERRKPSRSMCQGGVALEEKAAGDESDEAPAGEDHTKYYDEMWEDRSQQWWQQGTWSMSDTGQEVREPSGVAAQRWSQPEEIATTQSAMTSQGWIQPQQMIVTTTSAFHA